MIMGSIHQEGMMILNVYILNKSFKIHAVNTGSLKGEIGKSTIIFGYFNMPR